MIDLSKYCPVRCVSLYHLIKAEVSHPETSNRYTYETLANLAVKAGGCTFLGGYVIGLGTSGYVAGPVVGLVAMMIESYVYDWIN